jgi:hypothetical protein
VRHTSPRRPTFSPQCVSTSAIAAHARQPIS